MNTISRAILAIVLILPSGLLGQADVDVVHLKNETQVDVGYQFQEAFFERQTAFQNEIEEKRLKFNRIVIRAGIIF